jgi:hypothetical protein
MSSNPQNLAESLFLQDPCDVKEDPPVAAVGMMGLLLYLLTPFSGD